MLIFCVYSLRNIEKGSYSYSIYIDTLQQFWFENYGNTAHSLLNDLRDNKLTKVFPKYEVVNPLKQSIKNLLSLSRKPKFQSFII